VRKFDTLLYVKAVPCLSKLRFRGHYIRHGTDTLRSTDKYCVTHRQIHICILQLPNTAHSCTQHRVATPWLTAEWPGNITYLPKTFTMKGAHGRAMWRCVSLSNS